MVIVDSSVLIAILFQEPDAGLYQTFMLDQAGLKMAAPTFLECNTVAISKLGPSGLFRMKELISLLNIEVVSFSNDAAILGSDAFAKFGKGQGHRARLNFGDCMSYALSKIEAMPLLFKGDDFRLTDVECAL